MKAAQDARNDPAALAKVILDHIAETTTELRGRFVDWDVINAKRAREGWPPVERMGWLYQTPEVEAGTNVAPLATPSPLGATRMTKPHT